jgi:hypothetical protein
MVIDDQPADPKWEMGTIKFHFRERRNSLKFTSRQTSPEILIGSPVAVCSLTAVGYIITPVRNRLGIIETLAPVSTRKLIFVVPT